MTTQSKAIIRRAMQNAKGDDLERAKRAFSLQPQKLLDEYGESGKTRQQILDGYQQDRDEWAAAMAELEAL